MITKQTKQLIKSMSLMTGKHSNDRLATVTPKVRQ